MEVVGLDPRKVILRLKLNLTKKIYIPVTKIGKRLAR